MRSRLHEHRAETLGEATRSRKKHTRPLVASDPIVEKRERARAFIVEHRGTRVYNPEPRPLGQEPSQDERDWVNIAEEIALALPEEDWTRPPIFDSGSNGDRVLLWRLVGDVWDARRRPSARTALSRELDSVQKQAKALRKSLEALPEALRAALIWDSGFGERDLQHPPAQLLDNDERAALASSADQGRGIAFLSGLVRMEDDARRLKATPRGAATAATVKTEIEDSVAFSLACHGVKLGTYGKGALANVLRVAYRVLKIRGGGDGEGTFSKTTLKRLVKANTPAKAKKHAKVVLEETRTYQRERFSGSSTVIFPRD